MVNKSRDAVAIIGYGCVLPDAPRPSAFWDNVTAGKSALRALESPDFTAHYNPATAQEDSYHSLTAARVRNYTFDWRKFRVPPNEAELINPMQLMTLDAGAQALEGLKVIPNERTGLILGATGFGWQRDSGIRIRARDMMDAVADAKAFAALAEQTRGQVRQKTLQRLDAELRPVSEDNVVNASASVACGRIAMYFDLKGVHYSVDAGFSSSLAALDVAMSLLDDRTLDMVVTGGASELLSPLELAAFAKLGGLAANGLRPFDAGANGTLLGEGVALFALKRLDDALRDGEKIHAIVCAVEGSTDSAKHGLMAPNPEGQRLAMTRAWQSAGVDPATASFIECHATGTPVGDASEVAALAMLVENRPQARIPLGSAKPMVGHLRAAAGAVGMLRAVMALEHRQYPAQLGFATANPALELETRPFVVPTAPVTLRPSGDLYCGVSAFGFGGSNYHAVLASAPVTPRASVAHTRPAPEPIAIVGLGGRFPGADNVGAFWQRLLEGYDATRNIPIERWDVERYFDSDRDRKDTCYTRLGCFLESIPPAQSRWRIPPAAQRALDPSQLLLLHAAEEALTDSRLDALTVDRTRVSVQLAFLPYQGKKFLADSRMHWRYFAGWLAQALSDCAVPEPTQRALLAEAETRYKRDLPPITEDTLTGYLGNIGAARIARVFGFNGPHYVVDSACASTHAALDAAVRSLRNGQVDLAISGGVWCDMMPEFFVAACRFQALSAIGSRPFADGADGFIPGEGAGLFVLRRLSDAERDKQKIYGLLRSVAGSSDGKGRSVLAPTVAGEGLAMRRAIEASGVAPETIDYVECHGTGTALGDVVETQAVQDCYGPTRTRPLLIGSVKSNIGHLNAAAGAAALMKTTLALHHGILPASLKATPLSSKIAFDRGIIAVVREQRAWPDTADRPRRAAVSGFGVGGSNLHMIVEQYIAPLDAQLISEDDKVPEDDSRDGIRTASGATAATALAALAGDPVSAGSFHAAVVGRDADTRAKRITLATELVRKGGDVTVLRKQGVFVHERSSDKLCLTFPGQGPQYANMARELAKEFAPARQMFERLDTAYVALSGHALSHTFWTDDAQDYRQVDEDIHCAVFAVSCAIAAVLQARGLRFDAVLGQSAGLYGALVAAQVLTPEEGLRAVRERTRAVLGLTLADPGKMLYLSCSAAHAQEHYMRGVSGFVAIAADNGPSACIVSGETPAIHAVMQRAQAAGAEAEILPVSHAYHSRVIEKAGDTFLSTLTALKFLPPQVDIYSSVDGQRIAAGTRFAWIPHLVAQFSEPVRMPQAVTAAHAQGCRVFVECGPKWPLTSFVEEILASAKPHEKPTAIATMHPKVGEVEQMRRALAELQTFGVFGVRTAEAPRASETPRKMSGDAPMTSDSPTLLMLLEQARRLRSALEARLAKTSAPIIAAAPLATPATAPVAVPVPAAATPAATDRRKDVETRLVARTVAKTGYPADMLELHLDLEADLGIDTVKQLAIVAEVREALGLEVDPRFKLRDFRTLGALIDHFAERLAAPSTPAAAAATAPPPPIPALPVAVPTVVAPAEPKSAAPAPHSAWDDIRHRLVRETIQRTGYPEDMLELDLDLEADLGIDTVKQLAIVSEVRKSLALEVDPRFKLRDFRTLRALIDHFAARTEAPVIAPVESSSKHVPFVPQMAQAVAGDAVVLSLAHALSQRSPQPAPLQLFDIWRVVFAPHAPTCEILIAPNERGERLQWSLGTQVIFECVVAAHPRPIEIEARSPFVTGQRLSGNGQLRGLVRLDPGIYSADIALAEGASAPQLIDAVLTATALCWGEAHGERTVMLRAREASLAATAWSAGTYHVEIELAPAPQGKSRARAIVRAADGSAVGVINGIEGEWPESAGSGALVQEDWQQLRQTVRADGRSESSEESK